MNRDSGTNVFDLVLLWVLFIKINFSECAFEPLSKTSKMFSCSASGALQPLTNSSSLPVGVRGVGLLF